MSQTAIHDDTLPKLPVCDRPPVDVINPDGGEEPICARCFHLQSEHQVQRKDTA